MTSSEQLSPVKQRLLENLLRARIQPVMQQAPVRARKPGEGAPLAPCQHQIWLHAQLNPEAPIYNEPVTVHFRGALERAALERAFAEIIQRHEIWRTTFDYEDGQIVQVIHDQLPVAIPYNDLTSMPVAAAEKEAVRLGCEDASQPFDLKAGPLIRARLIRVAEERYQFFLVHHHLIQDGTTIYTVLMSELPALYDAFASGQPSPLPPCRQQYADFALWQKRFLETGAEGQVRYWRRQLSGELPPLDLPPDRPRPRVFTFRGAAADFPIPEDLVTAVHEAACNEGVTPYVLMLTAYKTLLFRYTGHDDLLVGTLMDGRRRLEFAQTAGFLTNTVALRTKPSVDQTFREYLHQVRDTVLDALSNSDVPMDRLVREIQLPRDPSRHPIFQTMFTLEPPLDIRHEGWDVTQSEAYPGTTKLDLDFQLDARGGGYAARLTYSTDLFDASTIQRLFWHWRTLLAAAIRNPTARLMELPLLTAEETEELCVHRNATQRTFPSCTVTALIESQVARTPEAVAVRAGSASLTYAELDREANDLASALREAGAGPGTLVALCLERSCDMLTAVLAVLKSGAAYLPLDPELPQERQDFILQDSRAPLLVRHEAGRLKIVRLGEGAGGAAHDLAHVLYTSGSTGKPKGVEIPHRAVVNFLQSMRRTPGFTGKDRLLAVTTLSFDIAGLELYLPLICGGQVVLADRVAVRDPMLLQDLIRDVEPTVMQATPATWRALIDAGWKGDRRMKILCGGEAMTRDLADQLLARSSELWNMYGPTETTIWSTVQRVTPGEGPVPIGRPIDNTQVYVLDSERRLVPTGVTGELYIGGAGVARGYLGKPELTAERFVEVEAAGNARLYRTGDLARWRRDGTLECLGRSDHQVKIRGFRVEPEEIEAVLTQHPEVRAAAVKAWPDASGHLALAAYVVTSSEPDVRCFLRNRLPEYMVPSVFVRMDELPLTPNRKIDRNKLPPPDMGRERAPFVAAESDEERRLAQIWESILNVPDIGIHDDFFRAGGHSLLVPKLLAQVEREFGVRLAMSCLFEAPTVHEFARLLRTPANGAKAVHPLFWLYPGEELRHVVEHLKHPFMGIALSPEDERALPADCTLEQIASYLVRDIRGLQPHGPYSIGGWCDTGILAYEVASQLRQQGCEVDTLILLDSVNPVTYLAMPARQKRASKVGFHLRRIASLRPDGLGEYVRGRVRWAQERVRTARPAPEPSYEERFSQASEKYVPPRYAGRVLALHPERMPSSRDPLLHWKHIVTGEFEVGVVRGDHLTMFTDGAAALAGVLEKALRPTAAL